MPTPHINAPEGAFAPTVLMPGDPLRAKHIADTFLADAEEVTNVRNMLGFTGSYRDTPVSVMGSGMGIPSASIYAKELITEYAVANLIRVGSCGGISESVDIRDVIIAMGACTDSGVNRARFAGLDYAAIADYRLLRESVDAAAAKGIAAKVGNIYSADLFYNPRAEEIFAACDRMQVLAVEMEAAGLYGVAAEYGAAALGIMTVSDHIKTGAQTTSEERQSTFNEMVEIALETAVAVA